MFQVVTISRLVQFYFIIKSGLFIRFDISFQENGPNYRNYHFHNYAGIVQTCSEQRQFLQKVCVGVSSVCYLPVQLSWGGPEHFGSPYWPICRCEFFVFNHVFVLDPQQAYPVVFDTCLFHLLRWSNARAGASAWSRAS